MTWKEDVIFPAKDKRATENEASIRGYEENDKDINFKRHSVAEDNESLKKVEDI